LRFMSWWWGVLGSIDYLYSIGKLSEMCSPNYQKHIGYAKWH
jgi:hypothetical protein